MKIIKEYLKSIEVENIITYKNMTTVGLKGLNFPEIEYLTLNEVMGKNLIEITEVDESGIVSTLNVTNNGDSSVLLFDGEEVKGAKQNRVLNTTILVPEYSEIQIPVSCTEQGRWDYKSPKFEDSGILASSKIRKCTTDSVSESLKQNNSYSSNQDVIWDEVDCLCDFSNVKSSTNAMNDVYEAKNDNLEDYAKKFPLSNQNGVLIFINNEIIGMELLSSEDNYAKYHKKIIKSYSLDALLNFQENNNDIDFIQESKNFINEIDTIDFIQKPSLGYGYDCRFINENMAGALLIHENAVIHGAFFKKFSEEEEFEENIVSSSRKARNYINY